MTIGMGSRIRISLSQVTAGQVQMNVWDYLLWELVGTPTAGDYGEAWWNHVKTVYRGLCPTIFGASFTAVHVTELGSPLGEYGEYSIPVGERDGTRTVSPDTDALPSYAAVGVRLAVGTRLTRPGQKRLGFLTQSDAIGNDLQAGYNTAAVALMDAMSTDMVLGAPAVGVVLRPYVVGLNADGTIRASQAVIGYSINQKVTSQVSRRFGRGV